uniref:SdpI family protein n=1 Tax=Dictyoglomus thermophilum TaxID=14 RepID=A0A7C3MIP2_DICTH
MYSLKGSIKKDIAIIILITLMFIIGIFFYPYFPEKIPMHWNFKGEIDRYGSKFEGLFGIPLMSLGFYLLFLVLPYLDPKKENYQKFEKVYQIIKYAYIFFLFTLQMAIIIVTLGGPKDLIPKITPTLVGLLFIILGNYMPRIKPNWFVGIRTPWTLSNEKVWKRTHRFGGYISIIGGVPIIFTGFLPPLMNLIILILSILLIVLGTTLYSFILYQKLERKEKN